MKNVPVAPLAKPSKKSWAGFSVVFIVFALFGAVGVIKAIGKEKYGWGRETPQEEAQRLRAEEKEAKWRDRSLAEYEKTGVWPVEP